MKGDSENTALKKFLLALPLAGLAFLALVAFGIWGVALSYAVALAVAWDSAMAFFVFFGLSVLSAGFTMLVCVAFRNYLTKIYLDRYPRVKKETAPETHAAAESSSQTADTGSRIIKKKLLTPQNVGYALLVVAVILVIVAAALGCLDAKNWVTAREPYMTSKGYFAQSEPCEVSFPVSDYNLVSRVVIEIEDRTVVVKYADVNEISVSCYFFYEDEYVFSRSDSTLKIVRTDAPVADSALDEMLGIVFTPNKIERQVIVTMPLAYKDKITVVSENKIIYAKN